MDFIVKRASEEDFGAIFALLKESFPTDEYRPERGQRALFKRDEYTVLGAYASSGELLGIAALFDLGSFTFIEHLAVFRKYRSGGIGSAILTSLLERIDGQIYLEVEHPTDDVKRRRIAFYERNGFSKTAYAYNQPAFTPDGGEVPLLVMSRHPIPSAEEFLKDKAAIFRVVYGKTI